jgi:hypothetical protein
MTIFYDYVLDELRLKDVPDGSGGFYGSFYDTTTHTVASTTTAYPITLNTTFSNNGVSIGSPTSRIVFDYAGIYSITFSVQYENTGNQAHASTIWLRKNGNDVPDSSSYISVPSRHGGTNGKILTTVNYVLDLNANDYIEVYYQAESTDIQIATIPAGTTPTTPVSPSIILTAVQGGIIPGGSVVPATRTITTTAPLQGGGDLSADRTFSITQSSASTNGYLSSTDWSTFNNKQNALGYTPEDVANKSDNTALGTSTTLYPTQNAVKTYADTKVTSNTSITGATKTKITYDSKGLVTAGADATTADITDSTNKRYVTDGQLTVLGNTSGTNTGDETKTSIETKLGVATSSNSGYLSSTDWSTFNSKQNAIGYTPANASTTISTTSPLSGGGDLSANRTLSIAQSNATTSGYLSSTDWTTFDGKLTPNSPITGATKTKITYDSKGLVTAGADATTADISDSTNKRYVTDAQLTVIGNTSGTNSGNVTVTDSATIDFTLTGQALTGSVIQSGISHNNLSGIQGGLTNDYFHLTEGQRSNVLNLSGTNTGDQIMPVYGDGADGLVYFDGFSSYTFATFDGSSTYTLTRDLFATDIYIFMGITLITAGYRVFANSTLTVDGELHNNGSAGSGTTAGAGGLGGFFKAGGAGSAGLGTGSAGAVGTAQATPTANTWVGGLGGKGAMGRATNTTFTGGMITSANVTVPADADGGNRVPSNFINYLTRYIVGATNWQMTPSIGGGSGAKSIIGTTATSGAGGGGGGICFVASPIISGLGTISANGGAGGNASGTGGNFGGGGGGGGGIVAYIARSVSGLITTPTATGGNGGTSVIGTNGTLPIATAQGTLTTATQTMILTPTVPLTKGNLYMVTFHLQKSGGIGGSGINSMSGFGIQWTNANLRNTFNSIASPTRVIEIWYGYYKGVEPDIVDDETITVELSDLNTTARVIIDEIQNTDASFSTNPIVGNNALNQVDSATTLTVTLPVAPTAGNLVYSVFARSGGTATTAGAGNTLVNNQTTAPQISSQVSSAQTANTQTHTTASAVAGISMEIAKSVNGANGSNGWEGKVVRIYG